LKITVLSLSFIIFIFCSEAHLFGTDTDNIEKKHILENIKIMQDIYQKNNFDEKKYEDLCMMAFFYFNNAVMKKDIDDVTYKEDINEALKLYQKAVTINNRLTGAYKGLFNVYLFLDDEQSALNNINKAIENNENDFDAIFMLGNFYYKKADYQNALKWMEHAEKLIESRQYILTKSEYKGFKKMMSKIREKVPANPR